MQMLRKQYVLPFVLFSQFQVQEREVVEEPILLQVLLGNEKRSKMTMRIVYL